MHDACIKNRHEVAAGLWIFFEMFSENNDNIYHINFCSWFLIFHLIKIMFIYKERNALKML